MIWERREGEMLKITYDELLKDKRVIEEIQRHLWIESEKAGYDRGFEWAKENWLRHYAEEWVKYYMPEKLVTAAAKGKPKKKP